MRAGRHASRQTGRQAGRQTDRQAGLGQGKTADLLDNFTAVSTVMGQDKWLTPH